jgi:RNA ligase
MQLDELFSYLDLMKMKLDGYVKEQTHPDFPELRILNYTQKAQFDGMWNDVTEQCRGLIWSADTGNVIARPFRKFYNYGQAGAPDLSLDTEIIAMDKMDGSLGILYATHFGEFAIATRGSFSSEQAIHATKILNEKYADWLDENIAAFQLVTPLFEIIFPENRIVCDYGKMDDLVLLGAEVLTAKDSTWDADQAAYFFDWKGPVAKTFDYDYFGEALAAKPREGAEGFVIFVPKTGQRVKIKQEDYVALHRIVTGLNARTVWEQLSSGKSLDELIERLPDEFHDWVKHEAEALIKAYDAIDFRVLDDLRAAKMKATSEYLEGNERNIRKIFAKHAQNSWSPGLVFAAMDGKDYAGKVWKMIKPEGNITPSGKIITEDNS